MAGHLFMWRAWELILIWWTNLQTWSNGFQRVHFAVKTTMGNYHSMLLASVGLLLEFSALWCCVMLQHCTPRTILEPGHCTPLAELLLHRWLESSSWWSKIGMQFTG